MTIMPTKRIVVKSKGPIRAKGYFIGPITCPYNEYVGLIRAMIIDGNHVEEVSRTGETRRLTLQNLKDPFPVSLTQITCTPDIIDGLLIGESVQITNTTLGLTTPVTFTSQDNAIASVDSNGVVTGVKAGSTIIRLETLNTNYKDVRVNVVEPITLTCTPNKIDCVVGATTTIITEDGANFMSANPEIADVSSKGLVTTKTVGTTTITVTKEGYTDASVSVNVKNKPMVKSTPDNVTAMTVGEVINVTVGEGVSFKTANKSIVDVTAEGVMTAKAKGKTQVTMSAENYRDRVFTITVTEPAVEKQADEAQAVERKASDYK